MVNDCVFCNIVSNKDLNRNILVENDYLLAVKDIDPISKGHSLIISKKHHDNLLLISSLEWNHIFPIIQELSEKITKEHLPKGYNLISNIGKEAFQSVNHFHLHLIPKYVKEDGFIWKVTNGSQQK